MSEWKNVRNFVGIHLCRQYSTALPWNVVLSCLQNRIFDFFEGNHPEKVASVQEAQDRPERRTPPPNYTPPPEYLDALAQEAQLQNGTLEERITDLYRVMGTRSIVAAFTAAEVRQTAGRQLGITESEDETDRSSLGPETPIHLGCFSNPCTECTRREKYNRTLVLYTIPHK